MSRHPQPDLSDLEGLLEKVRAAGLATTLTVRGARLDLPPALELTVYRLIQEALTNTLKHAGPQASAWVELNYNEVGLVVQITDDGLGAAVTRQLGVGHGLPGMGERVAAWGGALAAGPGRQGGWRVTANLSGQPPAETNDRLPPGGLDSGRLPSGPLPSERASVQA